MFFLLLGILELAVTGPILELITANTSLPTSSSRVRRT
jgi:hypothetical protein